MKKALYILIFFALMTCKSAAQEKSDCPRFVLLTSGKFDTPSSYLSIYLSSVREIEYLGRATVSDDIERKKLSTVLKKDSLRIEMRPDPMIILRHEISTKDIDYALFVLEGEKGVNVLLYDHHKSSVKSEDFVPFPKYHYILELLLCSTVSSVLEKQLGFQLKGNKTNTQNVHQLCLRWLGNLGEALSCISEEIESLKVDAKSDLALLASYSSLLHRSAGVFSDKLKLKAKEIESEMSNTNSIKFLRLLSS